MSRRCNRPLGGLTPRVKVWLETEGKYCFGFGVAEILQAIDRSGSIKEAARTLGKSYRYVWGRVRQAEAAMGQPLVDARVGGSGNQRSALTDAARQLVADFLAMRDRMVQTASREFAQRFQQD